MKLYSVDIDGCRTWSGTLRSAQQDGRRIEPVFRGSIRICECRIRIDKASVLSLIETGKPVIDRRGRTWKLSARGALRLVDQDAQQGVFE